jgi:hypothetical protein
MISQIIVALALAVSPVEPTQMAPAPSTLSSPAIPNKGDPKPVTNPIPPSVTAFKKEQQKRVFTPVCKPCDCPKPVIAK